jgi:hypothetical protein
MRFSKSVGYVVEILAAAIGMVVVAAAASLFGACQPSQFANMKERPPQTTATTQTSKVPATTEQPQIVTLTGCLERDDETFRLKDTTGLEAPKARSWKSGFLKKSAASIEVVDAANRVKLSTHVGQRVSVTGMLVEREIQVRSLRRVAASCKDKPVA